MLEKRQLFWMFIVKEKVKYSDPRESCVLVEIMNE